MNAPYTKANHRPDATLAEYTFGKMPPQALPLEEAVLGAIMIDREALPAIIDLLKPESFYSDKHQSIYRACLSLFANGEPVDILTVSDRLRKDGALEAVGGAYYLTELTGRVASSANLEFHARIVAQNALKRDVIQSSTNAIREAYDESSDAFDLLHQAQKSLFDIANYGGRMAESVGRIGVDAIRQLDRAMKMPDGLTGVPCGLAAVDKTTGGWQPSDLVVLAARPGMGKTAFVICAALYAARQGFPVALFSLEMGRKQLVDRILSVETGIGADRIRRGQVTTDEHRRLTEAANGLATVPIYIDDTAGMNIFELRAKCRRMKMQYGIQLVIVDYLQLMAGDTTRGGNREQEISSISRGCKNLAKDLDVPVIALSQLSRAVEVRGGAKRPQLSDLRESGAIEQDSDLVGFLYRPEYYKILEDADGQSTAGLCELIIAKHRHGALDDIGLRFDASTTKFSDLSTTVSNQFPTTNYPTPDPAPAILQGARKDEDVPF